MLTFYSICNSKAQIILKFDFKDVKARKDCMYLHGSSSPLLKSG